jgi:WD40 repeat protein
MAYLAVACTDSIHLYRSDAEVYGLVGILTADEKLNVRCFSPDCSSVIGVCGGTVIIWDVSSIITAPQSSLPITITASEDSYIETRCHGVAAVTCSSTGDHIAVDGSQVDAIILYSLKTRDEVWRLISRSLSIGFLSFVCNDDILLVGSRRHDEIVIWNIDAFTGTLKRDFLVPKEFGSTETYLYSELALHPTDPFIAISVGENIFVVPLSPDFTDINTASPCIKLSGHLEPVGCLCFSTCGTKLASGSRDKTICVWCASTWEPLKVIQTDIDICTVELGCGATHVACNYTTDDFVHIYDTESGILVQSDIGCEGYLCFSPSGTVILM